MNCKEALSLLSAYIDGELSEQESKIVKEHLNSCELCNEEHGFHVAVTKAVSDLPEFELPDGFSDKLHEKLIAVDNTPKKNILTVFIQHKAFIGTLVSAACIALVFSTGMFDNNNLDRPETSQEINQNENTDGNQNQIKSEIADTSDETEIPIQGDQTSQQSESAVNSNKTEKPSPINTPAKESAEIEGTPQHPAQNVPTAEQATDSQQPSSGNIDTDAIPTEETPPPTENHNYPDSKNDEAQSDNRITEPPQSSKRAAYDNPTEESADAGVSAFSIGDVPNSAVSESAPSPASAPAGSSDDNVIRKGTGLSGETLTITSTDAEASVALLGKYKDKLLTENGCKVVNLTEEEYFALKPSLANSALNSSSNVASNNEGEYRIVITE